MTDNPVWHIIAKRLNGEITIEEENALKKWEIQNNQNQGILSRLTEIWNYNPLNTTNSNRIYKALKNRINYHEKLQNRNQFFYYCARIAAVLFIIVCSAILINNFIPLHKKSEKVTYQEISVPRGSRTSIILPDGSKAWISNNSKIKYPDKFGKTTRELSLKGEAYFEVIHNSKKPFIVNIGKDRLRVLGTKFSVSAYPEDTTIRADLLTGRIELDIKSDKSESYKTYLVEPSHSLVYQKTSGDIDISDIPDGFFDYWEKGIYTFHKESLKSLAKKIDRIYNVKILFENPFLETKSYSGSISIHDNIFTFMEAIKRTSLEPVDYKYENKKVFIYLKSN